MISEQIRCLERESNQFKIQKVTIDVTKRKSFNIFLFYAKQYRTEVIIHTRNFIVFEKVS